MKILIVAATDFELEPLRTSFQDLTQTDGSTSLANHQISWLTTGVGMVATAFALGRYLVNRKFDLAINVGIAGSFRRDISIGDVVEVKKDTFSELGAEDGEEFVPIEKLGFGTSTYLSTYDNQVLPLKHVEGITVNTVHGHETSIRELQLRVKADTESMEGAAFFYACQQYGIPSLQVRAISNYVEKRNRENWNVPLAISNVNEVLAALIKKIK